MTSDGKYASQRTFDGPRTAFGAAATAGLGVGVAAVFLQFYPRMCIGSSATALFVRGGSRFTTGLVAGFAGFWVGVMPYVLVTAPSDVSLSDSFGFFAVVVFVPAVLFVTAGAAMGSSLWRLRRRR